MADQDYSVVKDYTRGLLHMRFLELKVILFVTVDSNALSFLQSAKVWLEERHIYADCILINAQPIETIASSGQKSVFDIKNSQQREEVSHNSEQSTFSVESLLEDLLGSVFRSVITIPSDGFASTFRRVSAHADLVLISREMYCHESYRKCISENMRAPVFVMAYDSDMPMYTILPADIRVLREVLPLKKFLMNNTKVIVLSFTQCNDEEKMLMSYVQGHFRQPGYMYLEKESEAHLLHLLRRYTLVTFSETNMTHEMLKLQKLALQRAKEFDLSFVMV